MIDNEQEYAKAQKELQDLEERLRDLQSTNPLGSKEFIKAGIHKLIARIHEELAIYESSVELRTARAS